MYCRNCGKKHEQAGKFCTKCGHQTQNDAQSHEATGQDNTAVSKNKRSFIIKVALGVVAVVIVAAAVLFALNSLRTESERTLTAIEMLNLGERYLLELNYAQALVHFTSLIEVEPRNARAYIGAAEAHTGLGQTAEAADVLERGLENTGDIDVANAWIGLMPNDSWVYVRIADIFRRLNLLSTAQNVLQIGLERLASADIAWAWVNLDPMDAVAYLNIADILVAVGNIELAIEILQSGLNRTNNSVIQQRLDEILLLQIAQAIPQATPEPTPEATPEPTPEATPEPTPEPTPQPSQINANIGSIIRFGGIDWRVLDIQGGRALLLSDLLLEHRAYHTPGGNITWEQSTIRQYLNNEFFLNTFTAEERGRIHRGTVVNNNNPWWDTPGGNNTQDHIFLLSIEEVVRYFGGADLLELGRTESNRDGSILGLHWWGIWEDNAVSRARIAYNTAGVAFPWWLRSPGNFPSIAVSVDTDGYVFVDGVYNVGWSFGGVRPALWLNLES